MRGRNYPFVRRLWIGRMGARRLAENPPSEVAPTLSYDNTLLTCFLPLPTTPNCTRRPPPSNIRSCCLDKLICTSITHLPGKESARCWTGCIYIYILAQSHNSEQKSSPRVLLMHKEQKGRDMHRSGGNSERRVVACHWEVWWHTDNGCCSQQVAVKHVARSTHRNTH